jgi:integrase/recombinase XerC
MQETILTSGSIERYLSFMSANGASQHTIRAYRTDLALLLDFVKRQSIGYTMEAMAAEWLTEGRQTWAPKTTQRRLTTVRSWARWAGHGSFLASYRPPTGARALPHPLADGMDGVLALHEAARTPEHKALVVLCGMLGLRISEALAVRTTDISAGTTRTLTVHGKGDKLRLVPVSDKVYELLAVPFILALGRPSKRLVPLSDSAARGALVRTGKRIGLKVASHDLRMTFGTAAYGRSNDLRAVQELLGHSSSKTTELYTHVPMENMAAAASVV